MSWISNIFGGTAGHIIKNVGELADRFITTDQEKKRFEVDLQKIITDRMSKAQALAKEELNRKAVIIQAEMAQSDAFTKRCRPSVVYWGMALITLQIGGQFVGVDVVLPEEFWYAWTGLVGTWMVGRSFEKAGGTSAKMITGKRSVRDMLNEVNS